MSYSYPQDRHRDRREKGEQPYKDAKEAMTQMDAQVQSEAEAFGEAQSNEGEEERTRRLEEEAEAELGAVNQQLDRSRQEI